MLYEKWLNFPPPFYPQFIIRRTASSRATDKNPNPQNNAAPLGLFQSFEVYFEPLCANFFFLILICEQSVATS